MSYRPKIKCKTLVSESLIFLNTVFCRNQNNLGTDCGLERYFYLLYFSLKLLWEKHFRVVLT